MVGALVVRAFAARAATGVLVKLGCFTVALAFEEVLQPAAARVAADSDHDAHTFLATSEARAFEWLHCVMAPQPAAAGAAANFYPITLSCLARSAAQAFEYVSWVPSVQAATPSEAALFEESSCKHFLEHTFDCCWIFSGIVLLGLWKVSQLIDDRHGEDTKVRRIGRFS